MKLSQELINKQKSFEDSSARLALEVRHYLNTGIGKIHLENALEDFTAKHYAKIAEECNQ